MPMCDQPLAEPLPNARPMRGCRLFRGGSFPAVARNGVLLNLCRADNVAENGCFSVK